MASPAEQIKNIIKSAKKEGDVIELDLSSINFDKFTPEISTLIENEKNIEVMILSGCGLKTLEGFPKNKFQALDLSSN